MKVGEDTVTIDEEELGDIRVTYKSVSAGARNPTTRTTALSTTTVVARTVYGLVNVRTNGKKVLCATLNEKDSKWNISTIEGRHG